MFSPFASTSDARWILQFPPIRSMRLSEITGPGFGTATRPPLPITSSSLRMYFPVGCASFIKTRINRPCFSLSRTISSNVSSEAGRSARLVQFSASSETWRVAVFALLIQCNLMRSKEAGAPRSTYTHSSPVPALIHALVKWWEGAILSLVSWLKKSKSPIDQLIAHGAVRLTR
jgi:hypothetical protein